MLSDAAILKTPVRKKLRNALQPLTIPASPFLESLGFGTGVNVWKLNAARSGNCLCSPLAIKNVRKNMCNNLVNKYEKLLSKEADILRTLSHKNIIEFRGFITSDDGRKCLAMELGGDSLGNMIETQYENNLGPYAADLILRVTENVACALEYLHDEKNILHGDIKPYNIVIKNNFEIIKLCDFGVSIKMDENGVAHGFIGTPIYSAPECQEDSEGPVTCKSDIFSLGLVMWEMIVLIPPHTDFEGSSTDDTLYSGASSTECDTDCEQDDSVLSLSSKKMKEKLGTRPNLPELDLEPEYSQVIEIFHNCTEQDPGKRPSAQYLLQHLQSISS